MRRQRDMLQMKEQDKTSEKELTEKNFLEGINSKWDYTEELISKLEERTVEITQTEQKKKKKFFFNKDSLSDFWDNIKLTNILIIGVPKGEVREKGQKNYLKK